jgi:hypothetical protein
LLDLARALLVKEASGTAFRLIEIGADPCLRLSTLIKVIWLT